MSFNRCSHGRRSCFLYGFANMRSLRIQLRVIQVPQLEAQIVHFYLCIHHYGLQRIHYMFDHLIGQLIGFFLPLIVGLFAEQENVTFVGRWSTLNAAIGAHLAPDVAQKLDVGHFCSNICAGRLRKHRSRHKLRLLSFILEQILTRCWRLFKSRVLLREFRNVRNMKSLFLFRSFAGQVNVPSYEIGSDERFLNLLLIFYKWVTSPFCVNF